MILVGHVTKDGQIAGPRVVEHMVDAVLSFEGEGSQQFRILRAIKNRFGPTDEIGVFEMTGAGLREIANPSELFLSERELGSPGTAVFAGIEGTRPLLVEIQALVAPTTLGTPRRAVVGWDPNRLSMVLAVLEAHCGVRLSGHDVYLNVAGGLRIQEPAADVAAAAALVSSLAHAPLAADAVYFGEVSLSGAVRPVAQTAARLKEAQKLGFMQSDRSRGGAHRRPRWLFALHARDAGKPRRRHCPRWNAGAAPRRPSGRLTRVGDPSLEQHGACRLVDDGEQERPVDAEHLSRRRPYRFGDHGGGRGRCRLGPLLCHVDDRRVHDLTDGQRQLRLRPFRSFRKSRPS